MRPLPLCLLTAYLGLFAPGSTALAQAKNDDPVEKVVAPFLNKYCVTCHGPEKAKADLVLHTYKDSKSLLKGRKVWDNVLHMVNGGEMPPESRKRPSADELEAIRGGVHSVIDATASAKSGP